MPLLLVQYIYPPDGHDYNNNNNNNIFNQGNQLGARGLFLGSLGKFWARRQIF